MRTNNKSLRNIVSILLTGIMVISMCALTVFADATFKLSKSDQEKWTAADTKLENDGSDSLTKLAGDMGLTYSSGSLTFDASTFLGLTSKEQKTVVKHFMQGMIIADLSADGTNTVLDCLNSTDDVDMQIYLMPYIFDETKGDLIGAMKVVDPFIPTINVIIGVGALLAALALIFFSVFDIVVIVVPLFREKLTEKSGSSTDNKGRPRGVSAEAWSAITEAEGKGTDNNGYKSALWIYLKRRLPAYIVFGLVLSFLIFGGFSGLISSLLHLGANYA